jgi:predicted phosphodiesterase
MRIVHIEFSLEGMQMLKKLFVIAIIVFAASVAAAKAGVGNAVMPVGDGPFTFGVLSDCRSGDRVYKKNIEALARRNPDFVVFVGDILPTLRSEKQWQNFQKLSAPIEVPFYLTPGNHDIEEARDEAFWRSHVDLPGRETYYKFTAGDNLFVVLDSSEPGKFERVTGAQFEWLKKTLDSKKYRRQFVFVHHPLFMWKGAFHEGEGLDRHPADRDRLHRLFVEKGVDIVFHGHEHTYRRQDKDGVRYIVTGGAGSPLYSGFNHFMLITMDGATIKAKVIDRKGVMRDRFVMFDETDSNK